MRTVLWTSQAREDLGAIRRFISKDSPHYAAVVVARLAEAAAQVGYFPQSVDSTRIIVV